MHLPMVIVTLRQPPVIFYGLIYFFRLFHNGLGWLVISNQELYGGKGREVESQQRQIIAPPQHIPAFFKGLQAFIQPANTKIGQS
jgi:hypothetical protein